MGDVEPSPSSWYPGPEFCWKKHSSGLPFSTADNNRSYSAGSCTPEASMGIMTSAIKNQDFFASAHHFQVLFI